MDVPEKLPRGRHNLSREQVQASQRARLLRGMVDAVAEKGYAQTAVADVIGRAGLSRQTFYELFDDKLDCFLAAYDDAVARMSGVVRTASEFNAGIEQYLSAMAADPRLARVFMIEVYAAGPDAWRRRAAVLAQFADLVYDQLADDPRVQQLPDPRFAVSALVSAISSMVTARIAAGEAESLPQLAAPIRDLLRALGEH